MNKLIVSGKSRHASLPRIGARQPIDINSWVQYYRNDWGYEARVPAEPALAEPGSVERVEIYRQRIANGQPIHVVGDRQGHRPARAYQEPLGAHSLTFDGDGRRGCAYDQLRKHRYLRWYQLSKSKVGRTIVFIGFKPNEAFDRLSAAWALMHQFHRVEIANLFAVRSSMIDDTVDPIGPLTDLVIRDIVPRASIVALCWGHEETELFSDEVIQRAAKLTWAIRKQLDDKNVLCSFGLDSQGQPLGISQSLPLVRVPRIEGELELVGEDE